MWSRNHPSFRRTCSIFSCVMFCRSLFVLFIWTLYCLSFDLRLLITPLVFLLLLFLLFISTYYFRNCYMFILDEIEKNIIIDKKRSSFCLEWVICWGSRTFNGYTVNNCHMHTYWITPPYVCACPKPKSYVVVSFFVLLEIRKEVIVCFVDIGAVVNK